ncbi:phasin family protein [Glycomyces arizonensis]|uniref:phasin family protein n=1 Tax=Glycomyces arizonensis TaxID=256035 RepID=UPI0004245E9A|nr:phasin family protein [Glycomyces arizonensis]
MADTARAYFDTVFSMAGESGQRARDMAGKFREDLRSGAERVRSEFRSGAEQFRSHGSRTVTDIGRLVRAEVDAGLTRLGVATQNDLDDINLRLEHYEEELRELRMRLAEAEGAAATPAEPSGTADEAPAAAERGRDSDEPGGDERA